MNYSKDEQLWRWIKRKMLNETRQFALKTENGTFYRYFLFLLRGLSSSHSSSTKSLMRIKGDRDEDDRVGRSSGFFGLLPSFLNFMSDFIWRVDEWTMLDCKEEPSCWASKSCSSIPSPRKSFTYKNVELRSNWRTTAIWNSSACIKALMEVPSYAVCGGPTVFSNSELLSGLLLPRGWLRIAWRSQILILPTASQLTINLSDTNLNFNQISNLTFYRVVTDCNY